jgi:hypothetical protein
MSGKGLSWDEIDQDIDKLQSDKRSFTRLTALASWRSEYILRTRLLRSLARGKPSEHQRTSRVGQGRFGNSAGTLQSVTTFSSQLAYPVTQMHGSFGTGFNKKDPNFIHGASEQGTATISDPTTGKLANWGFKDRVTFEHFDQLFPGSAEWGLGPGDVVGLPNIMDVSQAYGSIYGEGCPGGSAYFRSMGEQRSRLMVSANAESFLELGIPHLIKMKTTLCSVWIAKNDSIPVLSGNIVGMMVGDSLGVVTAYSLGLDGVHGPRTELGVRTAKWVLSPGVPIIAITVDSNYSPKRQEKNRIWAVALNALGEAFYLDHIPTMKSNLTLNRLPSAEHEKAIWEIGRTVYWKLVEATRRAARPDPFNNLTADGSYSPRSSSDSMGLSVQQVEAETKEIEKFLYFKPNHFQKVCMGWDMRRKLEVDFAGDDGHGAGESIVVVNCGFDEDVGPSIHRHTRVKVKQLADIDTGPLSNIQPPLPSLFNSPPKREVEWSFSPITPRSRTSSHQSETDESIFNEEWRTSELAFESKTNIQISATAIDDSTFAHLATFEDPLLGMSRGSNSSSPMYSPLGQMAPTGSSSEIPGQRGRFLAAGTTMGVVYVWDFRAALSKSAESANAISPVRVIYTDSPQISSLALTALYLVHGGNDGLVQAWDPLASTDQPIRTLNSRFSTRARRRLIQAEASVQGVGNNYFAAGAICLDPDPTILRGMVSLGTHLRYWSYSSTAADQYKSSKRRLRRGQRGSNAGSPEHRFTSTGRGVLKDYIANEKLELEREKLARKKEKERLTGRFGTDLLGPDASDEDLLAYARMLSEESYTSDEVKRKDSASSDLASPSSDNTTIPADSSLLTSSSPVVDNDVDGVDDDIAEAIRLSLESERSSPPNQSFVAEVPIRYKTKGRREISRSPPQTITPSASDTAEKDDLEFALQLSLAEAESSRSADEDFPPLTGLGLRSASTDGKGKGRAE